MDKKYIASLLLPIILVGCGTPVREEISSHSVEDEVPSVEVHDLKSAAKALGLKASMERPKADQCRTWTGRTKALGASNWKSEKKIYEVEEVRKYTYQMIFSRKNKRNLERNAHGKQLLLGKVDSYNEADYECRESLGGYFGKKSWVCSVSVNALFWEENLIQHYDAKKYGC